jgi:acetyl esterase/lipase
VNVSTLRVVAATTVVVLTIVAAGVASGAQSGGSVAITKQIPYIPDGEPNQTLDVYRQAGTETGRPTIVLVHGGGWHGGNPEDLSRQARFAAEQGWVAFNLDYRTTISLGTDGDAWPTELLDVKAALAWVRVHASEYGADASKLAVLGSSAGGTLAALAGADPLMRVTAMALWSAPTELAPLVPDDAGIAPACGENAQCLEFWRLPWVTNFLGCQPEQCPDRYREASPLTRAGDMPPVFVANATAEIVPLSQAEALATALADADVTSELEVVPGARHATVFTDTVWNDTMPFLANAMGVPEPEPIDFEESPFGFGLASAVIVLAAVGIIVAVVARIRADRRAG